MERSTTEAGTRRGSDGSRTAAVRRDYAPEGTDERTSMIGLLRRTVTEFSEDNLGQELNAERERSHELAEGAPRAEREIQLEPRA
jgi:hypothetical protein